MTVEKVTRDDIRAIEVGKMGVFTLPNAKAVESARVQFATMKRLENMVFKRVPLSELRERFGNEYDTIVPDEDLTIAYKRIK